MVETDVDVSNLGGGSSRHLVELTPVEGDGLSLMWEIEPGAQDVRMSEATGSAR